MNSLTIKRRVDLLWVLISAPLWIPVMLCLAFLVWHKMGSPIFFRQARPGFRGKIFKLWKFRTMTEARDADGELLPDAQRLTSFGQWLRATSLDELPELFNVLRGEMSLVGPRPLLVEYLNRYTPEQARRHEVPPGVSGWAQVHGRNALSWEDKFKLDVWYADNQSLRLDLKILAMTAREVFLRNGINAPGEVTMPEFHGNRNDSGTAQGEKRSGCFLSIDISRD